MTDELPLVLLHGSATGSYSWAAVRCVQRPGVQDIAFHYAHALSVLSPYNILARWNYAERDFFITSRLETLRELLPAGEKLSLRGGNVLKNVLTLLSESGLPSPTSTGCLAMKHFGNDSLQDLRMRN